MACWKVFFNLQVIRGQLLRNTVSHFVRPSSKFQTLHSPILPPAIVSEKKKETFKRKLSEFGFSAGQIKHILNSPHSILHLSEKELSSNFLYWLKFELTSKMFTVLTSNPELLCLKPAEVKDRISQLMTVFTRVDIDKLFRTSPQVFLDDFATIMKKIEYIVHTMGVEQKSIIKSEALQFDLEHMKNRHIFMHRSGHYKVVKKNLKSKNPPLYKVFSRNMETFLKLTKLTEEEYNVFCDAYKVEEEFLEEICQLEESFDSVEENSDDEEE